MNGWRRRRDRGRPGQVVERFGHPILGTRQQVSVTVEDHNHRRVPGAGGNLRRRSASGDPEGNGGVSEIMDPKRGEVGFL